MKSIFFITSLMFCFAFAAKSQCTANAGYDYASCGLTGSLGAHLDQQGCTGYWSCPQNNQVAFSDVSNPGAAVEVPMAGIYSFVWTVTDGVTTTTDTALVEFIMIPTTNAGPDLYVCGDTVQLQAVSDPNVDFFSWSFCPVFWLNPVSLLHDSTQLANPNALVNHIHTINDSVIFVAVECKMSTIELPGGFTMQCTSSDSAIVYFYVEYPAYETVDSQWDTVQCGSQYCGLNALAPPQGTGHWYEPSGNISFSPSAYDLNACATTSVYGSHVMYWVVQNSACVDTSDAIPMRFIEMPIANTGGNLWAENPDAGSEIKWETVWNNKFALNPVTSGPATLIWLSQNTSNISFVTTNSYSSTFANDTVLATVFNSDPGAPPYYEFYLQRDNSVLPYAPFSHGCIDRDTLRITFLEPVLINGTVTGNNLPSSLIANVYSTTWQGNFIPYASSPVIGGNFQFSNISGEFIIQISDTISNSNFLTTYYGNTYQWQNADTLNVLCGNTYNVSVNMSELSVLTQQGLGHISGYINYAAENKLTGEPVPGVIVYLQVEPMDDIIAHTVTNINGLYSFDSIPDSTYSVLVDIPMIPQQTSYYFNVSPSQYVFSDLNFIVDTSSSKNFGFGIWASNLNSVFFPEGIETVDICLYPNPVNDVLYIKINNLELEDVNLKLYDISGRIINIDKNFNHFSEVYSISVSGLSRGLYFLKCETKNGIITRKIVIEK